MLPVAATRSTPLKPCTLGGPALGMAVDVFDDRRQAGAAGEVGELVCTTAVAGR